MSPQRSELESLLERYERPLVKYAHGILGDLENARDVVQETFLKWIECQPPYPFLVGAECGRLEAWLFTVCRNRAIDFQRKQSRIIPMAMYSGEEGEDHDLGPDRVLERRELSETLSGWVSLLPPNQRDVIQLKFQMDRSYREIAEITGLSVGNVGFLLHTALRRLREMVESGGGIVPVGMKSRLQRFGVEDKAMQGGNL
jgi:RNA polymerase sigma factor (sigma-70 family)